MPTNKDYAKIHIALKELGLDDQNYRDILHWKFKAKSAKELNKRQVTVLLNFFKSKGWKAKAAKQRGRMAADPQSRKIRALWITMHQDGLIKNPSEAALSKYVKRMTGVERLEWCAGYQKARVIEALKKWGERSAA